MSTLEEKLDALLKEPDSSKTNNLSSNQMTTNLDSNTTTDTSGFDLLLAREAKKDKTKPFSAETASETENAFGMFKSKQKKPSLSNIFTEVDTSGAGTYVKTIEDTKKISAEPFKAGDGLKIHNYNSLKPKEITKEKLLNDNDFLADARAILKNRHYFENKDLDTKDKVWNAWTERQRYYDMGHEVTLSLDFDYLLNPENKFVVDERTNRYGRLLDVWEKYKGEDMTWRKFQDYAGATMTSPSNILAMTGSTLLTKLGSVGAKEAGKVGI